MRVVTSNLQTSIGLDCHKSFRALAIILEMEITLLCKFEEIGGGKLGVNTYGNSE